MKSTAQSAGLKVSDTKADTTVEAAIVTANWRKNCPEIPEMKAEGTNTAQSVRAMAISAPPTSSIVRCAASLGLRPICRLRSTFSTTTIASSTTIPTASTRPKSERLLREMPQAASTVKVPSSEIGMATIGMMEARHVCRNTITTTTTSPTASRIVRSTSRTDWAMKIVVS